jgi:periplasmic protein TonB
MKPESILRSDILDILFENRNKDYGAYVLRKNYEKHLMYAIGAMSLAVAALMLMSFFKQPQQIQRLIETAYVPDSVVLVTIEPDPIPPLPKVRSAKPAIGLTTPVITRNEIADTIPEAEQVLDEDVQIGIRTVLHEGSDVGLEGPVEMPSQKPPAVPEAPKAPEILITAEQMPEFPGGTAALYRFLSRNLRVPDGQLAPGDKVRVAVKFVVDTEGEITGIRFAETAESVFRQEVLRVMKKMPKLETRNSEREKGCSIL